VSNICRPAKKRREIIPDSGVSAKSPGQHLLRCEFPRLDRAMLPESATCFNTPIAIMTGV
jgi:hypothetical protein